MNRKLINNINFIFSSFKLFSPLRLLYMLIKTCHNVLSVDTYINK